MSEKVTGYSLIALGILMMLLSLFFAWRVFSGKVVAPQIFKFQGVGVDLGQALSGSLPPEAQLFTRGGGAKTELLSGDVISAPLNLTSYLLFMGFVATIGGKIASVGAQLVRTIKVDLKQSSKVL